MFYKYKIDIFICKKTYCYLNCQCVKFKAVIYFIYNNTNTKASNIKNRFNYFKMKLHDIYSIFCD